MALVGPSRTRYAWLSITPEPERELPAAIATLRAGGPPSDSASRGSGARVERLVTRAQQACVDGLHGGGGRAARAPRDGEGEVAEARALVLDVIDNHDNLRLGLPGGLA